MLEPFIIWRNWASMKMPLMKERVETDENDVYRRRQTGIADTDR